jgi:hypothetical protein
MKINYSHPEEQKYFKLQIVLFIFIIFYNFLFANFRGYHFWSFYNSIGYSIGTNFLYTLAFLYYFVKGLFNRKIVICSSKTIVLIQLGLIVLDFALTYWQHVDSQM